MKNLTSRLMLCYLFTHAGLISAEDIQFEVSPKKCVTLKQGNDCYQDIEVKWQTPKPGNYCLLLSTKQEPVKCWSNSDRAMIEFEFIGNQSATLGLVESDSEQMLEQADIEVKWVYRNRSRNLSWRVF